MLPSCANILRNKKYSPVKMPIIDNTSHRPFGLFLQNSVHVCHPLLFRSYWRNNSNPNSQNASGALATTVNKQEQTRAAGNFHVLGGLCHTGQLYHSAQQHGASKQTVWPSESLATRQAFATLEDAPNPKDEGKKRKAICMSLPWLEAWLADWSSYSC